MSECPEVTRILRVCRPVADLGRSAAFYCAVLGWEERFRSRGREELGELQLVGVGPSGATWHIELLASERAPFSPKPTEEDLLVVFVDVDSVRRMEVQVLSAGVDLIEPSNPYWRLHTCMFRDPDGYYVAYSAR